MLKIMTARKLKQIKDDEYRLGVAKGYELRQKEEEAEKRHLGIVIGNKVIQQVEELFRHGGM